MPRGRKPNLDKKVKDLIGQLKAALVARARQRIEARVNSQVSFLVGGLQRVVDGGSVAPVEVKVAVPPAATKPAKRKRKSWSPAAREAARKRMKARWAAKRKGKKGGKAKAGLATSTPR